MFSEKTVAHLPLPPWIFSQGQGHQNLISSCYILITCIYSWKSGKNSITGLKDIVQTSKCPRIFSFSTAVTLKIRPRSPKYNQLFIMSQLYIHANLVGIQLLVHKILCRQESVTPMLMPTGSAPKKSSICPHRIVWAMEMKVKCLAICLTVKLTLIVM